MRLSLTIRIRSLVLLVVLIAVVIGGWIIYDHWRLYSRLAIGWRAYQVFNTKRLAEAEDELRTWRRSEPPKKDYFHHGQLFITKEQLQAERKEREDLLKATLEAEVAEYQDLHVLSSEMATKYRTAARRPWQFVSPDPALPFSVYAEVWMRVDPDYIPSQPSYSVGGGLFGDGVTRRGFRLPR